VFPPSDEFVARARITDPQIYEHARRDLEGYWSEQAAKLDWMAPWNQVLDRSNAPFFTWFTGGKLNVSVNCLDRHLAERGDKVAYHWEGEPGETEAITYRDLYERVCRLAGRSARLRRWLLPVPVPLRAGRRRQRGGRQRPARPGRVSRDHRAMAGDDAHPLG